MTVRWPLRLPPFRVVAPASGLQVQLQQQQRAASKKQLNRPTTMVKRVKNDDGDVAIAGFWQFPRAIARFIKGE